MEAIWDTLYQRAKAVLCPRRISSMMEAAGVAAAQALDANVPIWDTPIAPLQKTLADTGVLIHFDDAWIPAHREDAHAVTEGHL